MIDETASRLAVATEDVQPAHYRPAQSYWSESWERLRGNRVGMFTGAVLVVLALIAIAAPLISQFVTHFGPTQQDLANNFAGFTHQHLLGTDELGRDTLTRVVWGSRVSLGIGFLTVLLYILIGASVGLASGYYGGLVDDALMRFVDVILSIPAIYLLILITSILPLPIGPIKIQHDAVSISVIIAITAWGGVARLVRGEVLSVKSRDFIMATRSIGATDLRIISRHLVPNVLPVMIVSASLGVGQIILLEAALDFIGLGVQPPVPSWGNMLFNAQSYFFHSTSLVFLPGIAIVIAVLAANIFGNAVRDAYDPRLK